MRREAMDERVFVVAPRPVVLFFPKVRTLLADLRRMDPSEREAAAFYSVDGEVLQLAGAAARGFHLGATGHFNMAALSEALVALADDPSAGADPRTVAAHLESQMPRRFRRWGR